MSPTSSHIGRVIDELEAEREHLTARLAKVDAAIATMRELFHLPGEKAARGSIKPKPAGVPASNGKGHAAQDAIREALHRGPLSPGELAAKVGMDRSAVRYYVKQLEADGVVVVTGTTASRSIALAGTPAKEAPQR